MFGDLRGQIVQHMTALATSRSESSETSPTSSPNELNTSSSNGNPTFRKYHWPSDGKFHNVPEGFQFVTTNASVLWELWHYGNVAEQIAPYRLLQKCDFKTAGEKTRLISARNVMNTIFSLAKEVGAVPANVRNDNLPTRPRSVGTSIFQAGFSRLIFILKSNTPQQLRSARKFEELQVTTLHIDIKKHGIDEVWKRNN